MTDSEREEIYSEFTERMNIPPKALEEWLQTEESRSVGEKDGGGESTGHASGRRIVKIKRKKKSDLTDDDFHHMRKVVNFVKRHAAQRPSGDMKKTPWRYSLMNWGHDPLEN